MEHDQIRLGLYQPVQLLVPCSRQKEDRRPLSHCIQGSVEMVILDVPVTKFRQMSTAKLR
eukprot:12545-Eustigmatos_ZCMA.PRE.1